MLAPLRRALTEAHALHNARRAGMLGLEPPQRTARIFSTLIRQGPLGGGITIAALKYGSRTGLVDEKGELSFDSLEERSNAVANTWRAAGIAEGSVVGILCRNHRGLLDATYGAAKLGARILMLNTDFAGPQLAEVCAREGVELLVHDEEFASIVEGAEPRRGRFLAWTETAADGPTLESLITAGDTSPPPAPDKPGSVVLLTSGTTGTPKGAPRSHVRSLAPIGALLSKVPFRAAEVTYVAPPMFHGLGFTQGFLATGLGCTLVVDRRPSPAQTLARLAEHGCTALVVVPVQLARILALGGDELARHDLSALRIIFSGGSNLDADLARRTLRAFGDKLYNFYGSTEVAWATFATPEDLRAAPGCAGRPPFGTTIRLYDDDDRLVEGPGQTGRIFVDNGFAFDGYTGGGGKQVIDGLMSTGDVGHFDTGGRLFVDGRDDDMIVSGGENVFPAEVEDLLASHDAIEEAAAIGVPDEEFGQRLQAFVVLRPGQDMTDEDVRAFVRSNLARYKVPREVVFVGELPRNPAGKVIKRELLGLTSAPPA